MLIKGRNKYICNIKAVLIFLVVLGHVLENYLDKPAVLAIYKFIYIFHMPLFVFISGKMTKSISVCKKQMLKSMELYCIFDLFYVVYERVIYDKRLDPFTPYWHLWYLFALIVWSALGMLFLWLQEHKVSSKIIFFGTVIASLMIGTVKFADRRFALQRIFAFLPYFYLGMTVDIDDIKDKKWIKIASIIISLIAVPIVVIYVPKSFIYQATPYSGDILTVILMRLVCEIAAAAVSIIILLYMPDKKLAFTAVGKDTLPIYVFHPVAIPVICFFTDISLGVIPGAVIFTAWIIAVIYMASRFVRPINYLE